MNYPTISIIFPNYNGKQDALEFIASVFKSDYPQNKIEIIMIDNGSTDGSAGAVAKKYPQVKVIRLEENLGPGVARNEGIKNARKEIIFLADNDSKLESTTLKIMTSYLSSHPEINILGPKILHVKPKGELVSCGFYWNRWLAIESGKRKPNIDKDVDWVACCALMIRKKDLEKIGLFDRRFFLFAEDADFCLRAKKMGFKVRSTPSAIVYHDRSTPPIFTPQQDYYNYYYSKFLLIFKYSSSLQILFTLPVHLLLFTMANVLRGNREYPILKIKSFLQALYCCYRV